MIGKIGIVFFALVSFWLLWRCIAWPLWGQRIKKRTTTAFVDTALDVGKFFRKFLFWVMILAALYFLGLGILELAKPFGKFLGR